MEENMCNKRLVLDNVREYCEEEAVTLELEPNSGRLCVVAVNEGGYNCTLVDAEDLYKALKEYFEKGN